MSYTSQNSPSNQSKSSPQAVHRYFATGETVVAVASLLIRSLRVARERSRRTIMPVVTATDENSITFADTLNHLGFDNFQ